MNLNNKLQRLAEILGHDADEIQLYLEQYPKLSTMSRLQLLCVAIRHQLDPLCDEISVMETPDGALPFITIDGWMKLINRHEQFAGMSIREPSDSVDDLPKWVECSIYRHDRILPIVVREYLDEVKTEHGSWTQMPRRMLRHRAIQQCARIAFGITGAEMKLNGQLNGSEIHHTEAINKASDQEVNSSSSEKTSGHYEMTNSHVSALKHRLKAPPTR